MMRGILLLLKKLTNFFYQKPVSRKNDRCYRLNYVIYYYIYKL
ncbi:hypothetical protein B4113_0481 [Geobacillus sp. B4113_201601]|nr:hypothetical protein B4113_0481 [Geobacillus sp. B4113_201601]